MNKQNDSSSVNKKRWAAYSAAGLAALVSGADSAEAEITHIEVGTTWTTDSDFYYALDGSAALNFYHPGDRALVGVWNGGYYGSLVGVSSGGFNYASNLASGVNVSTQGFLGSVFADFADGGGYTNSQFVNTSGFFAFRFDGGAGQQFGWGRLTAAGDSPVNTFTIEEYAFADVGEAIEVGQTVSAVPEPGSLGLLALGAVGVLASRRKKLALAS
ncbi:PEP-CTERM sorting domain-containing protein [Mariniblastus fucicola]|uniref:PEP-CTERM motif protein n=1 Tax=Mariniblastus fucicola TaxID=980251 RepID=A0A5B9P2S9_9BACT|nr:PEP-CTERM sorting domain-containing protein [Mariniblastus fucicola]QEG20837.1 PEP-CTERM motif protein [Mariniblastus fucicola]